MCNVGRNPAIPQPLCDVASELDVILSDEYAHQDIVHHDASQRHHTAQPRSSAATGLLHACDPRPDTTWVMLSTPAHVALIALAVAATAATAACGSNLHSSSSSPNPSDRPSYARAEQDWVDFADCMRAHSMPGFPDPTSTPGGLKSMLRPGSPETNSPAFQSAATACQHLLPGGGPGQHEAHSPAQIAAFLAFARCIRSHGLPNFPDPTSGGQLTHQMLADAGINIQLPAVQLAADACVGVTHGVITKAAVARFVAGH